MQEAQSTRAVTRSVLAPLPGWVIPLEQVPDPVFSGKMVGDGVAIEPLSGELVAPVAGEVIQLHAAHHALTLRTPEGLDVLLHVGLDTVMLRGEGFNPVVRERDNVKAGDLLLTFDIDPVAQKARSLLTLVLITNMDDVGGIEAVQGRVDAGAELLAVTFNSSTDVATDSTSSEASGNIIVSDPVIIPNPAGLHARPAATLVQIARPFNARIHLVCESRKADITSISGLMGLDVRQGASVLIEAQGEDADAAVNALQEALRSGLGELTESQLAASQTSAEQQAAVGADDEPPLLGTVQQENMIFGVKAAPGVALGVLWQLEQAAEPDIESASAGSAEEEAQHLHKAVNTARHEIEQLSRKVESEGLAAEADIFRAHLQLLEDPALLEETRKRIAAGKSAAVAWKQTLDQQVRHFQSMENQLLAGRAVDLKEVGKRVLDHLLGVTAVEHSLPDNTILVARELAPGDVALLDRDQVKGLCTAEGGATSHAAILARSMGLPFLAGAGKSVLRQQNGVAVVLDADTGRLLINPDDATRDEIRKEQEVAGQREQVAWEQAVQPAVTKDGKQIEVCANIESVDQAEGCIEAGAEGVGLLRTEFLYMNRLIEPSVEEQQKPLRAIQQLLGSERPMLVRTLDVGGDKPLPYLPLPQEENPFLGVRGIRIGIERPGILRRQLQAILPLANEGKLRLMFPMIAMLDELRAVLKVLDEECQKLGVKRPETGIMVEVPSAAVQADILAREVDFFSIGTNDLTQYTLAIDRGHPGLAARADGFHPAVLRLIYMTAEAAHDEGKWVGVCGGLGGEPLAVPLLLGLGIDELSACVPAIPEVKACIRSLDIKQCQQLAQQALQLSSADEVRALVKAHVQY